MTVAPRAHTLGACQRQLVELDPGELVSAYDAAVLAGLTIDAGYVQRADALHAARQRLARLSELGYFRCVDADQWRRSAL